MRNSVDRHHYDSVYIAIVVSIDMLVDTWVRV